MFIRKARIPDVLVIQKLINEFAEQGLMLARSLSSIYESIREFVILEENNQLIGVGALHILWDDLAEIRALAIMPQHQKKGCGKKIVQELLQDAHNLGIKRVFALTYQPGFFEKCGFKIVSKEELPHKVWKECINCPKFPNCDETAVIKNL